MCAYNRTVDKVDHFLKNEAKGTKVIGAKSLQEMVAKLKKPRRVMLLVKGKCRVDNTFTFLLFVILVWSIEIVSKTNGSEMFVLIKKGILSLIVAYLIPAGDAVDNFINQLIPLLEPGDIIIDGGNSEYTDSNRRCKTLKDKGLLFVGSGVSGGEEGARYGPSLMPGGAPEAW